MCEQGVAEVCEQGVVECANKARRNVRTRRGGVCEHCVAEFAKGQKGWRNVSRSRGCADGAPPARSEQNLPFRIVTGNPLHPSLLASKPPIAVRARRRASRAWEIQIPAPDLIQAAAGARLGRGALTPAAR